MTRRTIGAAAVFGLCVLAAAPAAAQEATAYQAAPDACPASGDEAGQFAAAMDAALAEHSGFEGRILIQQCSAVIYDRSLGVADHATGMPIGANTVFDFGSLTKAVTAAAILHLRDEGRLSLDDTLGEFVDGLAPDKAGITIHQLLTHTAGLELYSGEDYDRASRADLVAWLRETALAHPPEERWAYSNPGYSLLAMIVEDVSEMPYDTYVHQALFEPLGLEEIGYRWPRGPQAVRYLPDGEVHGTPMEGAWAPDGPYWNLRGNGGILANPRDFLCWFDALRGGRVLSEESTRLMFSPLAETGNGHTSYGYGWRIIRDGRGEWLWHGGSNGATFYSHARYFPQSDAAMVFSVTNFDGATIAAILEAFSDAAAPEAEPAG